MQGTTREDRKKQAVRGGTLRRGPLVRNKWGARHSVAQSSISLSPFVFITKVLLAFGRLFLVATGFRMHLFLPMQCDAYILVI